MPTIEQRVAAFLIRARKMNVEAAALADHLEAGEPMPATASMGLRFCAQLELQERAARGQLPKAA